MNSEPKDIKACMFMKRRFAYAGHAMAMVLQKKYGVKDFCGYTSLRSSLNFLQSQKDIHYSELALDEDVHKLYRKEKLDRQAQVGGLGRGGVLSSTARGSFCHPGAGKSLVSGEMAEVGVRAGGVFWLAAALAGSVSEEKEYAHSAANRYVSNYVVNT